MKIAEAAADARELSLDLRKDVLDDRIARLTALETLSLTGCGAVVALPAALTSLPLKKLQIRAQKDVSVVMPPLVGELNLEQLDVDNVAGASLVVPKTLRRFVMWSRSFASDFDALAPRLAHVVDIALHPEGDLKDGEGHPIPAGIGQLTSVTSLELGRFDGAIPDTFAALAALRTLETGAVDVAATIRGLARTVPWLETLRLKGKKGRAAVPDEVAGLTRLQVLDIRFAAVAALSPALASLPALRELGLHKLEDDTLPDEVGSLGGLEKLTLGQVNTLPASLAGLTKLKSLQLRSALNKGALVSRSDDIDRLKPLPKALSSLTSLEDLNLGACGVFDLAPLRPLTRLKRLALNWSGISHVDDLAALTNLEVLDLEHCDRVKDLSPLRALTKLRELNLESCRPKNLDVLRELPSLKTLHIESIKTKNLAGLYDIELELTADEEVLERYRARAALRRLPPLTQLRADLGSDDVAVVEAAIDHLAEWTLASSSRAENAITVALGLATATSVSADDDDDEDEGDEDEDEGEDDDNDDDDEGDAPEGGALAPLDAALARHSGALSPRVLARLFGALFQRMEEDWSAAAVVAREVAARGDRESQLAVVEAFLKAGESYDAGHRMWEETTQDLLIDEILPGFGAPALTRLLVATDDGWWTEDGLASLLAPALTRADDADRAALWTRLEGHLDHRLQYGGDPSGLLDELAAIDVPAVRDGLAGVRARAGAKLAALEQKKAIESDLRSRDAARIHGALARCLELPADDVPDSLLRGLRPDVLDDEGFGLLLQFWTRQKRDREVDEVLVKALTRDVALARRLASTLGLADDVLGARLRARAAFLLRDHLREEERHAPEAWDDEEVDDDAAEATTASPLPVPTRRSTPTLDALRAWCNELQSVDDVDGQTLELCAVLGHVGRFEREWLRLTIEGLATHPTFAPTPAFLEQRPRFGSELASDVGQLVMDEDLWPWLRLFVRHLGRLRLTGTSLERVLAQLLAVCMREHDDEGVAQIVSLLPGEITWDILAFNLACHCAVQKDKEGLLRFTRRALQLGKSPSQFTSDSDFAAFLEDPEFQAVLRSVD